MSAPRAAHERASDANDASDEDASDASDASDEDLPKTGDSSLVGWRVGFLFWASFAGCWRTFLQLSGHDFLIFCADSSSFGAGLKTLNRQTISC